MAEKDSGIGPESELEAKDKFRSEIKSPIEVGISYLSQFNDKFKVSRFSSNVTEVGIFPLSLLPEKSIWVRLRLRCLGTKPVRLA